MTTHTDFLTPPTPFQDRVDRITTAFSPVGWRPDASTDMARADQAVAEALEDLRDQFTGPSHADLEAAGVKFGAGKGVAAVRKVLEAPDVLQSDRFRVIYAAARRELVSRHDLPEYAVASLVAQGAAVVADVLPAMAREAVEALEALPEDILADLEAGRLRVDSLDRVEVQNRPLEHISALRAASAAWAPVYETTGGAAAPVEAWTTMFRAVASGDLQAHSDLTLESSVAGKWALWLDAPAMVALASGFHPVEILRGDLGTMDPLADPLGTDREAYRHRVAAYQAVDGFLGQQTDRLAGDIYRSDPLVSRRVAQRRSAERPLRVRTGYSREGALEAVLDAHPEYAADLTDDDQ